MAIVYSDNIIEIAVIQSYAGRPAVNVWHMWFSPEGGSDTKTAVVEDFRDNWQDHIMLFQDNGVSIQRFEWRSLDQNDNEVGIVLPDSGKRLVGGQATPGAPPNVAVLLKKGTDSRPRGRRDGRAYIVGVAEDSIGEDGSLTGSLFTTMQTEAAAFYNGISDTATFPSGDRYPAVLETTPASRAPGSTPVVIGSRRVTSITVDPKVATQRERLR